MVFQSLNLSMLMLLMDCKAGSTVSSYLDVFLDLSESPCVSHSAYWCLALPISFVIVKVLVSKFPFMCSQSG